MYGSCWNEGMKSHLCSRSKFLATRSTDTVLKRSKCVCTGICCFIDRISGPVFYTNQLTILFLCFSGFMYAYVCYLSEECPACLVLLTADRESFHALSQAKTKITEVSLPQLNVPGNISCAVSGQEKNSRGQLIAQEFWIQSVFDWYPPFTTLY